MRPPKDAWAAEREIPTTSMGGDPATSGDPYAAVAAAPAAELARDPFSAAAAGADPFVQAAGSAPSQLEVSLRSHLQDEASRDEMMERDPLALASRSLLARVPRDPDEGGEPFRCQSCDSIGSAAGSNGSDDPTTIAPTLPVQAAPRTLASPGRGGMSALDQLRAVRDPIVLEVCGRSDPMVAGDSMVAGDPIQRTSHAAGGAAAAAGGEVSAAARAGTHGAAIADGGDCGEEKEVFDGAEDDDAFDDAVFVDV